MTTVFLAYASGNSFHETIIRESAQAASTANRQIVPWSEKDASGQQISRSVESWIDEADAIIADVSAVNTNVTYEIGYAVGQRKPVRIIRSSHTDFAKVQSIGLLDTLGHDAYNFQPQLKAILQRKDASPNWPAVPRNRDQPIFILQPPHPTDASRKIVSAVKKIARYKFRTFNPAEISRLTASEAYEQVAASFGVISFWIDANDTEATTNNQRAAFIFGLARGMEIPCILIAHESSQLPLDLHDIAARWGRMDDLDGLIENFRNEVADELVQFSGESTGSGATKLANITFGDPVAENEQSQLHLFFLETEAYVKAVAGQAHVLVGRKGSGKSAIFFQVRDAIRSDRQNIVIDLMPEGYQLIKLKEYILDRLGLGARKEVIAAFWEYVLWLEITYKILEKDKSKARYDSSILERYQKLEDLFYRRVDTGLGDFSERLRLLSDNVIERFQEQVTGDNKVEALRSSEVLEIIYGKDLRELRDSVLEYLRLKGVVLFLFDNLDRIWTPGGFNQDDALILVGLAEAMQEITRKFAKKDYQFHWVLFIRSDVYEFLIAGMADYGKLSTESIEWSDREQLKALFNHRMIMAESGQEIAVSLADVSEMLVSGTPVMDFLIDGSMMRPRYLIRLFETARRRALTLGRAKIAAADYVYALSELGWQAIEDIDREIVDLVSEGQDLLFELLERRNDLTPEVIRYIAGKKIPDEDAVSKLIDVMVWNGSLGVRTSSGDKYIFDTGYKRKFLASLIHADKNANLVLHPTLCAALA